MLTLANDHVRLTLAPEFGARVTGLTDLAAGHYVALCNLLAHYGKGMHAEFTVK